MTPMTMMSLRQDLWPSVSAVPALLRFEESFMELAPDRGGRVPRSFPDMKTTAKKTNRKSTNRKKLKTDRKEEHADNHGGGSLQVSRQKQPHGKFPPKIKESKSCPYEYVANEKANMASSRPPKHVAHEKANMAVSRPHEHVAKEKANMGASHPHEHVAKEKANMAASRPHKHVSNEKANKATSRPQKHVANVKAKVAASRPYKHVAKEKANVATSRPHKHVANEKAGRKESPEQAGWLQRLVRQLTAIFFPGERRQAPFNIDLGIQFR